MQQLRQQQQQQQQKQCHTHLTLFEAPFYMAQSTHPKSGC